MSNELEALRPMFERIIREEVQKGLKTQGVRHRFIEVFVDPASGQLSCSRVGIFLVVAVLFPASLALQALGFDLGQAWTSFVALAGTLAGVYGLNSAARVWRNGGGQGYDSDAEG
ncbi:MAG: hypothetical protein QME75_12355 [Deltaproteobacteria bacterium]|nr:hypothetical protein [Deltaproteobacteria bacterium]